jgi:hypothetical protein
MTLPIPARERLADLLQPSQEHRRPGRVQHTVPIGRRPWRRHLHGLADATEHFASALLRPDGDFATVRAWALQLTGERDRILALLLALEPFVPFNNSASDAFILALDDAVLSSADALRKGTPGRGPSTQLRESIEWWSNCDSPHDEEEILAAAFGLSASPLDANGQFRADWVLQHYAYNNGALITRIVHHLDSLGVPFITDILAGTGIIGGLLACDDPIAAYASMDTFVTSYFFASPDAAVQATTHLHASEPALQRTSLMTLRASRAAVAAGEDIEARALALADIYKRSTEGPFRQYAWALQCMREGRWGPPPMLTNLRERLAASGGCLAALANEVVLPGMRNSEAHETLEWDGIDEEFITESGRVALVDVVVAVSKASSFAAGCEAGLAAVRVLALPPDHSSLPDPNELGRMPAWRRAHAYFGTNNLRLTKENLNTRDAQLQVAHLRLSDVNPCFQALLMAHRLLPRIDTFTVSAEDDPGAKLTVSAVALRANMPVWEYAVSVLDRMPLATFLPANFEARRRVETESVAIRSASWIAVDDVLDAIDGGPETWDETFLHLLNARLRIVEIAVSQVVRLTDNGGSRLVSLAASVVEFRHWLECTPSPNPRAAEKCEALRRLRLQWGSWGPVARHPLVRKTHTSGTPEPQSMMRQERSGRHFRTL